MRATVKSTIAEVKNNLAVVGGKVVEVKKLLSVVKGVIVEAWKVIAGYNLTGFVIAAMTSSNTRGLYHYDTVNKAFPTSPSGTSNIKVVSPSGRYMLASSSDTSGFSMYEHFSIYRYDGYEPTLVQTLQYHVDIIPPMEVDSVNGWNTVRFSTDDSRIVFLGSWFDATTTDRQTGFVILKRGTDGLYSYEKKICIHSAPASAYTLQNLQVSADLSTVVGMYTSDASKYVGKIFKGNPDNGYELIYSNTITYNGYSAFDEDKAEYVLFGKTLLYINGSTVTGLTRPSQFTPNAESRIVFNGDRTLAYISYYYGGNDYIRSFSISNKTTFTYLGQYYTATESSGKHIICDHAGQSDMGIVCIWEGTSGSSEYKAYPVTFSKNDAGSITGFTKYGTYQIYAKDSSYLYIAATRFINRAEQ